MNPTGSSRSSRSRGLWLRTLRQAWTQSGTKKGLKTTSMLARKSVT